MQEQENNKIILTKPYFSSDGDNNNEYRPPKLIRRILSLFRNVRVGSDFTSMKLPAHFNVPKSQLQGYGETLYGVKEEILARCNKGESSIERLIAVASWNISILHPFPFGIAPFNPILGETHHVSRGSLNVLLEQISHNPPVSALHATDEEDNLDILWCQNPVAKFYGTSIELEIHGKRQLKLHNYGETYLMHAPKLLVKLFPVPGLEWIGTLRTQCLETGLEAELSYSRASLLGLGGYARSITGKIFDSATSKSLFIIDGHWDKTVNLTDLRSQESRIIYNAKEITTGLKTPIVKDLKGVLATESAVVWSEVSKRILDKDWGKATQVKKGIEENQRKLFRDRKSSGETWSAKHFTVVFSNEVGWDCSPIENIVPQAPIIVP